jgi:transmembrane protein
MAMMDTASRSTGFLVQAGGFFSQPGIGLLARIALAVPFLVSGVVKAADFPGAVAEVEALAGGPSVLLAVLVIVTQIGGSLLMIASDRFGWMGAIALAGFTAVATILGHPFWAKAGPEAHRDMLIFLEHVAIGGGLVLAAGRTVPGRNRRSLE